MTSQMREIRTSGSARHKTHPVTSPRPRSEIPIIGTSALLQLVEWYHVHRQASQHGGSSCVNLGSSPSPPAPNQANPSSVSEPALADSLDRTSGANPGHPQPHRGPAACDPSGLSGGDS